MTYETWMAGCTAVLSDVLRERKRQEDKYTRNDALVDGTGPDVQWLLPYTQHNSRQVEFVLREEYDELVGGPTWMHLVREEIAEAFQETDPARLEEELVQVAALCVSWVERIRARATMVTA